MGKGEIITHISGGQYSVKLLYNRQRITAEISSLTARIAALTTKIAAMEAGTEKDLATFHLAGLQKRKTFLEDNLSTDPAITAWCADLTEDLTGIVGTVEVPGERGTVLIQPGYDSNAAYDADRDGQLQKILAGTPEATFYNLALLPGWQKWMPTYRFGAITAIDGDTCDIDLDPAFSSAQNLPINQADTLSDVAIEYMSCNGSAFEVGDEVLIKFTDQDWNSPKVVGFKEEPRTCNITRFMASSSNGDIYLYENNVWSKVAGSNGTPFSVKFTSLKWGLPSGLHWFTWNMIYSGGVYTWTLYHLNKTTFEWDYFDEWEDGGDEQSFNDMDSLLYTSNGIAYAYYTEDSIPDTRQVFKLWDGGSIKTDPMPWNKDGELIFYALKDSVLFSIGELAGLTNKWFGGYEHRIVIWDGSNVTEHEIGLSSWAVRYGRGVIYCYQSASNVAESLVIDQWRSHSGVADWPVFDNRYMDYPYNDDSIAYIIGGSDVPLEDRYKIYRIPLNGTDFHELTFEDGIQVASAFPSGSPLGLRVIDEDLE